jgi:hypothetical protein
MGSAGSSVLQLSGVRRCRPSATRSGRLMGGGRRTLRLSGGGRCTGGWHLTAERVEAGRHGKSERIERTTAELAGILAGLDTAR